MVTREHLFLLMAKCHEISQVLTAMDFGEADKNQLRDELTTYANSIYMLHIDRVNRENRDLHASMSMTVMEIMYAMIEYHNNPVNQELQYVVKKLAAEWGIDERNNIILFGHGSYAVRHYHPSVFNLLNQLYHSSFTKKPRIVYVPQEFDGDMLFSSVVFHEVGHMIENDRSLGGKVYDELIKKITNPRATILKNYFRADYDKPALNESRLRSYIKEYIADLFGSQYLGRHILHYLNCHNALGRGIDSNEHPCYDCREKLVESFMDYLSVNPHRTTDHFLQIIIDAFHNEAALPDLAQYDMNLRMDTILQGNRLALANMQELFSSLSASWRASLSGIRAAENARGMGQGTLTRYGYYNSINQAAKDSIADYMHNNP